MDNVRFIETVVCAEVDVQSFAQGLKNKTGKRGRPALDPAVKAAREAEVAARAERSGGKRGRPKSATRAPHAVSQPTGGRRGRPALSPDALAAKAQAKAAVRARSGGKRGRPKRK